MGMIIPGPGSAAYADESGRYALNVQKVAGDDWRQEYAWAIWADGRLVASDDGLSGTGHRTGPAEALAVFLMYLTADADRWRVIRARGLNPDPFGFGPDVAQWAFEHIGVVHQAGEAAQLWAEHRG